MNNRDDEIKLAEAISCMESLHGTLNDRDNDCLRIVLDAALASQKDHIPDVGQMVQTQQTESKPVAWGYAWQCKSVGDWRIEKLGEGCIPPKDTLALYTLPPAPEGGE